jgi:hypothetical protein
VFQLGGGDLRSTSIDRVRRPSPIKILKPVTLLGGGLILAAVLILMCRELRGSAVELVGEELR